MKIFLFISLLVILGCNFDVDTSDPQASESIKDSQKDKLFIKEFRVDTTKSSCIVNEAWVEFSWKNKLHYGKIIKIRYGDDTQLVLKFNPRAFSLDPNEYLFRWILIDSRHRTLGCYNGLYTLDLDENIIPNNFEIYLEKKRPDTVKLCEIFLHVKE